MFVALSFDRAEALSLRVYILVSLEDEDAPVMRAFRITDGEITEEEVG